MFRHWFFIKLLRYQMATCIDRFVSLQTQGATYSQLAENYYDICSQFYTSPFK